jgi:hypothetical protein
MGYEDFPSIESFHKLPKKLVIKAGDTNVNEMGEATLSGIVVNNLGQAVTHVEVSLILFDEKNIPIEHHRVEPDPNQLAQGSLGAFRFTIKGRKKNITNYYMHARWKYVDKGWE